MTTRVQGNQYRSLDGALLNDGLLIGLRLGYWRATRPLRASDLKMDPRNVADFMRLGRKLMIPKEEVKRFHAVAERARYYVEMYSFDFPIPGLRYVPNKSLSRLIEMLESVKKDWGVVVGNFIERYDALRDQMLQLYPEHKHAFEDVYPDVSAVRRKFQFDWTFLEVFVAAGAQTSERPAALADVDGEFARREALKDSLDKYRQEFNDKLQGFLGRSVKSLREQVYEATDDLAKKIERGEFVTPASVKSVRLAIERFKALNFVGDQDVESRLNALEATLPKTRDDLDNEAFMATFQGALRATAQVAGEVRDVSAVTGEYRRRIQLPGQQGPDRGPGRPDPSLAPTLPI